MKNRKHHLAASRACVLNVLLATITACCLQALPGQRPVVSKVEPPNWWTNYSSPLMVLLYGDHLAASNITTDYPGVAVDKVQTEPDGNHAFVWLKIDPSAQP